MKKILVINGHPNKESFNAPLWWLGMPAVMKGFFDRAFLPGITFKSDKKGTAEGLLQGRT